LLGVTSRVSQSKFSVFELGFGHFSTTSFLIMAFEFVMTAFFKGHFSQACRLRQLLKMRMFSVHHAQLTGITEGGLL